MNLREDITNVVSILVSKKHIAEEGNYIYQTQEVEESILRLFKEWALEMVGENLANTKENEEMWGDTLGINSYKNLIRQRIEEATK